MKSLSSRGTRNAMLFALLAVVAGARAESPRTVISLEAIAGGAALVPPAALTSDGTARPVPKQLDNYRMFPNAVVGQSAEPQTLTLHFAATTTLGKIAASPDFEVQAGGTCSEGYVYRANSACLVKVLFTPRGPGRRFGRLTVEHSANASPFYVGLGGNSYAPVLSFVPAVISHVTGTYPNNVGLMHNASAIAIDGGDTLYIADTDNNVVRSIESSGTLKTIASSGIVAPAGVAADNFGEVFFSEPAANLVYEIFEYGSVIQLSGGGTDSCTVAAPCSMTIEKVYTPGAMAMDANNQLFFADGSRGAAVAVVQPYPATLARLSDPFTYQSTLTQFGFGVDLYDNIYTAWEISGLCQINRQTYSDAANFRAVYTKVAGGKNCGFSGDGGQARNADIGSLVGGIAFDVAGNMYFSDSANNRIRRVDASTGIIRTIAGSGSTGTPSDGGSALSAKLNTPKGLAVNSQGAVYFLGSTAAGNTVQSIRTVGPNGYLAFGSQVKNTSSATQMLTVSNTGNSDLTIANVIFTGTNHAEFTVDPATTSCILTAGTLIHSGETCQIGVIFRPTGAGARSAKLTFLDNSVTNSDIVLLNGTGTLPPASMTINSPTASSSVASGKAVTFKVSVTSAVGSAPTGKITFSVDGAVFGSAVTLASGSASTTLTGLTVKAHTLSAAYSGDSNYAPGTASESLTVTAAVTGVGLPAPPVHKPTPIPQDPQR